MMYLITQMALYLIAAIVLGVILGWLIWGRRSSVDASDYNAVIAERDRFRAEADAHASAASRVAGLESDLADCQRARRELEEERTAYASSAAGLEPVGTSEPVAFAEAPAAFVEAGDASRPEGLDGPRGGQADDLKLIKGVGVKLEGLLHSLGFYHFDQIANWSAAEVAWVDENLEGFKGRVTRDDWISQAGILAAGGATEFSSRQS
jgi:predicted flap endonuclease-1-like 5' DNA nuclease